MADDALQLITTEDGSHSLLHPVLNETYHSVHGALQESIHVFIRHGLAPLLATPRETLRVLEVGFGTGLNALLTWQAAQTSSTLIRYTSLEAYPVPEALWRQLNYAEALQMAASFERLHLAPWNTWSSLSPTFHLRKLHTTLQDVSLDEPVDLIYFDAFAPSKQPDMWTLPMLEKATAALQPGGVFVTYCAKGQLKRDLKSLGLIVETLAGPPGKKEMVRATRPL